MDAADHAQRILETLHAAEAAYRQRAGPVPAGRCYNCGADLDPGRRWCDVDCRDDWARRQFKLTPRDAYRDEP